MLSKLSKSLFISFFSYFVVVFLLPIFSIYYPTDPPSYCPTVIPILVPPAFAASEQTYFLHQDHLGSIIAVTDESGVVISQEKYLPYGKDSVVAVGQSPVERAYTGQIKDANTALQYYNARFYDPVLARFISADSVNDQQNRYAYVASNPIAYSDPSGRFCVRVGGVQIGDCQDQKNDQSFNSDFFLNLAKEKIYSNPEIKYDFEHAASKEEQVNIILGIAYEIFPYSPKIIDLYAQQGKAMERISVGMNVQKEMEEKRQTVGLNALDEEFLIGWNERLKNAEIDYKYAKSELAAIFKQRSEATPRQIYHLGISACSESGDFASVLIPKLIPGVSTYAGRITEHGIVIVNTGDGNLNIVGNPSWSFDPRWSGMGTKLISMEEFQTSYPYDIDWNSLGYDPQLSSSNADPNWFMEQKKKALNFATSLSK